MSASTHPHEPSTRKVLRAYFTVLFFAVFGAIAQFWHFVPAATLAVKLFIGAASIAYAALYTVIPVALTALASWIAGLTAARPGVQRAVSYATAVVSASLLLIMVYADYRLYELYEFHFNGFVWNLLTTPGGVAALGATTSTNLTAAFHVGLLCVAAALALWAIHRHQSGTGLLVRAAGRRSLAALLLAFVSVQMVYAYSTFTGREDYIEAAQAIPFHLPTSMTGLFTRLGVERTAMKRLRIANGTVDYPGDKLEARPLANYPNVIMLVAESFRWDLLDPEITPNLWKFAQRSLRFEHHYSGGNRTRMGLFSMFYGIYSPYWYSFENQRIAPALMNFVRDKDYQLALHTSQSFDYPELRHTVFQGVPEQYMQELQSGEPWQRDTQNISDLIGKLDHRDARRPFFGFMFFESTHAPYTFPAENVVRTDYETDLNYLRLNLSDKAERIHARYINAAHHVDREAGRLLDHLTRTGMLDNTIVLFTGDHGEEFMEKGHWGHGRNASFPEEQIRVPLVLHLPGTQPAVVSHRSSHLQVSQTLLAQLGVTQDPHTFSSAGDLFTPMPYFVAGDYNYMTVFDDNIKLTFPFSGSDFFRYMVDDQDDHPLPREQRKAVVAQYQPTIEAVISESARFLQR